MKDDRLISLNAAIDAMMKLQTEDIEAYGASIPEGFDGDRAVMALKALPSAQPVVISKSENTTECEDAVSRFEVLRLIDYSSHDLNDAVDNRYMQNEIKQLPSVTPKQPGWIPVTERLPKKDGDYLVTTHSGQIARYIFIGGSSEEYWRRCATAWMPLPTPYREGGQDETD